MPCVPTEYRVSPAVAARLLGALLVCVALLLLGATALVAALNLHTAVLLVPVIVGAALILTAAVLHQRRGWVVRVTDEGYRVQWVRGAGVPAARWKDVEDAVTATVAGAPVVVLRLRDGRTTTIPVQVLAVDREAFVKELQQHLQRGHGMRRL